MAGERFVDATRGYIEDLVDVGGILDVKMNLALLQRNSS